ncbi:hypothetical protein Q4493_02350 [Colwellia sp. 1_MG-2023]|uniref:hypothetical protein n=1 Tax=Colwellia sp. 1_MG-2023 TaxID=3062649 RepID=UPI0026E16311|nr:hypothetical protein [Colwellia sp. 1_MG-2023]MDO6444608.1 hypothetical protein [Colwellia sp. 1_MG-2023]
MSLLNNSNKSIARLLACLMLVQMLLGIVLNFYFLKPILRYDGSVGTQELIYILGSATLVALIISSLNLVFGLLLPKDRVSRQSGMFITLIVLAAVGVALSTVEYAKLSEYVVFLTGGYLDAGSSSETFEPLKKLLATGRNEAHFFSIFISSLSLLFFYGLVLREKLLPTYLASFAVFSVTLQLIAVGHTFFELSIPTLIQAPIALTQLIVPIYLLVAGFKCDSHLVNKQLEKAS